MLILSVEELIWLKNACQVIFSSQMSEHLVSQIESSGGVDEKLDHYVVERFAFQVPTNLINCVHLLESGAICDDERTLEHLQNLRLVDGQSLELLPIARSANVRRWLGL